MANVLCVTLTRPRSFYTPMHPSTTTTSSMRLSNRCKLDRGSGTVAVTSAMRTSSTSLAIAVLCCVTLGFACYPSRLLRSSCSSIAIVDAFGIAQSKTRLVVPHLLFSEPLSHHWFDGNHGERPVSIERRSNPLRRHWRTHAPLLASNDNFDSEMEYGDEIVTEKEKFLSSTEEAALANEMAAAALTLTDTLSPLSGLSNRELHTEIEHSFLQYALSIIMGRAIPDGRDGLKPVHRRILYAMDQLRLDPTTSHRKCARVVGEVLGKFHPHGDTAVYDALVRLAQDFNTNHLLVDGHGNFGSIDADPAAAMRYTECRLTRLAKTALLQDLNPSIVDYIPNFDGNEQEPTVLPARLPVLLLNGSAGIAVGMATNIPPHNLRELLAACSALVSARRDGTTVSDAHLLRLVPAPDFPTGATILGTTGAKQLYSTGNGGIVMRAVTAIENIVQGGSKKKSSSSPQGGTTVSTQKARTALVVTELPYQVNKAGILERIDSLVNDKKLEGISDLRDESDRDGIRIVIELKRDANPTVVRNNLFQKTALQTTFSGNFLALMGRTDMDGRTLQGESSSLLVPQRFTLRQSLDFFLDFRFFTIKKKARFELSKVETRAHIVDGLLMALANIDDVIAIIRSAANTADARETIQKEIGTSVEQTEAILKLQLGQLTRLNKGKLDDEKAELEQSRETLSALITLDNVVYTSMLEDFESLDSEFGVDRKTKILADTDGDINDVELVANDQSVIVVTRGGYIKRMPMQTFESQRRGTRGKRGTSVAASESSLDASDSEVAHCFTCNDHDTLLMVTHRGIAYGLRAYEVPIFSRTAKGQPIPSVLPVNADDSITTILPISEFLDDEYIALATEHGSIKKTSLSAFENLSSRGLTIAKLSGNDRLRWCQRCREGDDILIGSTMGKSMRFSADSIRASGRTSRGVFAMKLQRNDKIADMNVLRGTDETDQYALMVTANGNGKMVSINEFRTQLRGGVGVISMKFRRGEEGDVVSCLRIVHREDEILIITSNGIMVRQKVADIPIQSRTATGVRLQKLDDGDRITSVSIVPKYDDDLTFLSSVPPPSSLITTE